MYKTKGYSTNTRIIIVSVTYSILISELDQIY